MQPQETHIPYSQLGTMVIITQSIVAFKLGDTHSRSYALTHTGAHARTLTPARSWISKTKEKATAEEEMSVFSLFDIFSRSEERRVGKEC